MTWWLLQLTVDLVSLLLTGILEIYYHCFNELILSFHCLKVKKYFDYCRQKTFKV